MRSFRPSLRRLQPIYFNLTQDTGPTKLWQRLKMPQICSQCLKAPTQLGSLDTLWSREA